MSKMTRDEILAMEPGRELDKAVGKLIGATPEIRWYIMNADETAYCMDFDNKKVANDWFNDIVTRFPDSQYATEGYHIVREEIYRKYSEDISAAWKVVEKMGLHYEIKTSRYYPDLGFIAVIFTEKCRITATGETAPLAICRAALIAEMEVTP